MRRIYFGVEEVQENTQEDEIKRMANLLRQGSTLTDLSCPSCSSPLFRLKNKALWCGKCEKRVIVIKEGEDAQKITSKMALEKLEITLLKKVQEIQNKMEETENVEDLQKLSTALSELLDNLAKIREMKEN